MGEDRVHTERDVWLRRMAELKSLYDQTEELDVLAELIRWCRRVVDATDDDDPSKVGLSNLTGAALQLIFSRTGAPEAQREAVVYFRRAVRATPDGDPRQAAHVANLTGALLTLFERTGDLAVTTPTEALWVSKLAVETVREGTSTGNGMRLVGLANALMTLSERAGYCEILTEAVALSRQAAELTAGVDKALALSVLTLCLRARFDRAGDLAALRDAARVGGRAVEATPDGDPKKAGLLFTVADALEMLFRQTKDTAALGEAVMFYRRTVEATPDGDPKKAGLLFTVADALEMLFRQTKDTAALGEAVMFYRLGAEATPDGHSYRARRLYTLGQALQELFHETGERDLLAAAILLESPPAVSATSSYPRPEDLPKPEPGAEFRPARTGGLEMLIEAVEMLRRAVQAAPSGDPDQARYVIGLAGGLWKLSELTQEMDTLVEAVAIGRKAVELTHDSDGNRAGILGALAVSLRTLYGRTGNLEALTEAIALLRHALELTPDQPVILGNLGASLRQLFDRTGEEKTLTEAVICFRRAVEVTADNDPAQATHSGSFRAALLVLFERTREPAALTEAVEAGRRALGVIPDWHPDQPRYLFGLGQALEALFRQIPRLETLEEAVGLYRKAVDATPEGHPDQGMYLPALGDALRILFEWTGDFGTLKDTVDIGRRAVAATDTRHRLRSITKGTLGNSLQALFNRTGELAILVEAAQLYRDAVAELPDGHGDQTALLANLGAALMRHYEWTGELDKLTEAVAVLRRADAQQADAPQRGTSLFNLGSALLALFERTRRLDILSESVQLRRKLLGATPDSDPQHAGYALALSVALRRLFEQTKELPALTEALTVGRRAIQALPDNHPERPEGLSGLGNTLQRLSEQAGDLVPLTEAIQQYRLAVEATSHDDPGYGVYLHNLGTALESLFDRTGKLDALTEARDFFARAGRSNASVAVRIGACQRWGAAAMRSDDPQDALEGFEAAVELLPRLAPRRFARADREHGLGKIAGLGSQAATAAVSAGKPDRAIELLEQTRGILLTDVFEAHGDLTELRAKAPGLAEEFEHLRDALDGAQGAPADLQLAPMGGSAASASRSSSSNLDGWEAQRQEAQQIGEQRQHLEDQWQALLVRIRATPGFDRFLLPPSIAELKKQAAQGPVVFVYASPWQGGALILTANSPPRSLNLPGLTRASAISHVTRILTAYAITTDGHKTLTERRMAQNDICEVLAWLWSTVTEPILKAVDINGSPPLDFGQCPPGRKWPRLWWCPVHIMTYLPLHAAGLHHQPDSDAPTALDRVVSSYTTSIRALAYSRRKPPRQLAADPPGALIVAMPTTPGASPLPGVQAEIDQLARILPGSQVLKGSDATREAVLAAIPHHAVAHFACHGLSDWNAPAKSRLLLFDHATAPLTVTTLSRLHLRDADLAYLSACSTMSTSPDLADEAVHVTGAFQAAGYRHVIGTLWPVIDFAASRVASDVYTKITASGTTRPRTEHVPYALHDAIRQLRRDHPSWPLLWAGHVHIGS